MAAYAALVSLMHIIDDLQNHHSPPISLHKQQVQSLTEKVMFLQEFLEGYSSPVADGDEADPLEIRIADAAYAAEDVIESHIVEKIKLSRSYVAEDAIESHIVAKIQLSRSKDTKISRFINFFRGPKNPIKLYKDLQKVIKKMDLIKREAMKIDTKKVVIHDQGHRFVPNNASLRPSSSSTGKNSSFMVCSDDVLNGIMEKLVADQPHRQVIPIIGMGGIGKTTLAKTVYSKPLIKEHFNICAWATISQQYDTREILCEILSQVPNNKKEELSGRSEDELGSEIYKYLSGKRFLIVMDDMWNIEAWEEIHHFFPNNYSGSRVLVTTRISHLGSRLNNNYSHQMKFLDEANSWILFSKIVFGENNCPRELEEIGKKIVKNCGGLPLSIVVVGGILKNMKHTSGCWESIRKNLTSLVNLENDKHCLRLLKMSYDHLPVYLKPCFLYMGVFEENESIKVSRLVGLWVSEGFIKPMYGKSLETIARGFLKDLVDRNLVLVHELGYSGNIKYCKVHDLMRDFCLNEGKRDGFYHVIGQHSPRDINSQRRVVIPRNTSKWKVFNAMRSMSLARSVICENGKIPRCRNSGLLRICHAHPYPYHYIKQSSERYVNALVFDCVNLRHLRVRVGCMSSFLSSVNLAWNLRTLIVYCEDVSTAPVGIWKMPQFRHIEFILGGCALHLPDPPSDAVVMENIQILKGVKNFKFSEEVIKRIPNIKKLGIYYKGREGDGDNDYCFSNIRSLSKLESLRVACDYDFTSAASLNNLTFPHSLKSVYLDVPMDDELGWENMLQNIGSLPLLYKLQLWGGRFRTGKWEIVECQFPALKFLKFSFCDGLKYWTAQGSSIFPLLESLHLAFLPELKEIPSQIGDIPTLQRIELSLCNESVVMCAKEIVDEQVELQGDQLPFHVKVWVPKESKALTGPNFEVEVVVY